MRNFFKTFFGRMIAFVIVGLLVLAFAFFGVNDVMAPAGNAVALVGDGRITATDFSRQFDMALNRRQQDNPEYTREQAMAEGFDREVLNSLAAQLTLVEEAEELGLAVSDEAVADFYREQGLVNPITGRLDPGVLAQILSNTGQSKRGFERAIRRDLTFDRLVGGLPDQIHAPEALNRLFSRYQSETRDVRYVSFQAGDWLDEIGEPDDVTLAAYYQRNAERYAEPEARRFTYVLSTPDDFIHDITFDETVLEAAYRAGNDEFNRPERRSFVQINAPDLATAERAAERLEAGEDPQFISADMGLAAPLVREDLTQADIPDAALAQSVFDQGDDTARAVEGALTAAAYKITSVTPGFVRSFEEARPDLYRELALRTGRERAKEAIETVEEREFRGADLETAAAAAGLPAVSVDALDRGGSKAPRVTFDSVLFHPEIISAAYSNGEGQVSEIIALENSYVIVRVDEVRGRRLRDLDEVREQVIEHWRRDEAVKRANLEADKLVSRLEDGALLDTLAGDLGLRVLSVNDAGRLSSGQGLTQPHLDALFRVQQGGVAKGPFGEGVAVAQVAAINQAPPETIETLTTIMGPRIDQSVTSEAFRAYQTQLARDHEFRTFDDRFERLLSMSAPQP